MAGVLQSTISTYMFTLEQMKQLIASDLGVPTDTVDVEYVTAELGGDFMDRSRGVTRVVSLRVTVKHQGQADHHAWTQLR